MSRAEDPQLHTHVVAANMARGADGRWTALDATPIYQRAKAAGFLYQAHLRAAVRECLPWVGWGPVRKGMAEIEQVAPEVLREFSTRRRQIEERERELAASVSTCGERAAKRSLTTPGSASGTELTRRAGRRSCARAAEHGLGARELQALVRGPARAPERPNAQFVSAQLAGAAGLTERQNTFARREAVMAWAAAHGQGAPAETVERAAAEFLTRADVQRAPDATEARYTTSDLLAHEEVIVRRAQARRSEGSGWLHGALVEAVLENVPFAPTAEQAAVIRGLTSTGHGVESVEALAGTGKTFTAGLLARAYSAGGYRVLGTAPTARAVRELKEKAGITHASTLTRLSVDLDADPNGFGAEAAVLILDEAGMASTRETARVLEHAAMARVKVIAIGDSGQLSSVQAGGWLGSLTRRLGSDELREVMRQRDPRERALLAHVHRGDPAIPHRKGSTRPTAHLQRGPRDRPCGREGGHRRLARPPSREPERTGGPHRSRQRPPRASEHARTRRAPTPRSAGRERPYRRPGVRRRRPRHRPPQRPASRGRQRHARHDPRRRPEREGTAHPHRRRRRPGTRRRLRRRAPRARLPLTAHTIQGGTVDWAGVVGHPDDFTRNWSYTALSRARDATELFLIDTPTEHQLDRTEIAPDHPKELADERTPLERLEATMRRRDDEDLALDRIRIDSIASAARGDISLPPAGGNANAGNDPPSRSVDQLRTELAQLRERIASHPDSLADQLQAARDARAEAQRVADEARARIADLERPIRGVIRRRSRDPAALAFERERLSAAEQHIATAAERERELAANTPDWTNPGGEHEALRERAAALEAKLAILRQQHLRNGLEHGAPHLTAALGPLPAQPYPRRTWQQAADRIEAYRFDHAITDSENALGPPPTATAARRHWQRAQQDIHRAQRELGLHVDRRLGHQL